MMKISKLALAAALVAVSVASPALAQSFNPRDGTGNVMPLQYQGTDGGRTAWAASPGNRSANVQVAVRKSGSVRVAARENNSEQVALRHGRSLQRVAGHRLGHHGAA